MYMSKRLWRRGLGRLVRCSASIRSQMRTEHENMIALQRTKVREGVRPVEWLAHLRTSKAHITGHCTCSREARARVNHSSE